MSHRYREEELVRLLAEGRLSCGEIGEKLGLSQSFVQRVASGRRRPELQQRIREARETGPDAACRLGRRWVRHILTRHIKIGMEEDGETARKCREYALNQFIEPEEDEAAGGSAPAGPLPEGIRPEDAAEFYRWKSRSEGGPTE